MGSAGPMPRSRSSRQPACRTCQRRRVRCDGLKVCTACLRRAAWEGLPPPEACEYATGSVAPAESSGSAYASSSSSTDLSTRNCAARASAGSPAGTSIEQLARFGGGSGRPLQKGLACLACKARRVRCDSARPACSSCRKTSKFKTGELRCIYRADLYLQRRREEEEAKLRLGDAVPKKKENEDVPAAGEKVEPKKAARTAGQHVVKTEPDSSKDTLSGSPALTGLPALLPPLPALPSLPTPYYQPSDTIVKCESPLPTFATPQSIFAPAPSPADYFTTSTALRSDSVSSQAGFSTNPPSPSFTISETDLSSWPSPCSPFDEWCDDLPTTYPPVPYPPACPATSDFNSPWSEACSSLFIPALVLSTPLQSLGLTDISTPSCSTLPLGDPLKIDSSVTGMDSTLTLPFAPSFAGEWNGGGSSEL